MNYFTDEITQRPVLEREGDTYTARVVPMTPGSNPEWLDEYVPNMPLVESFPDRQYMGVVTMPDNSGDEQTIWTVLGINPLAVMNHLIRHIRQIGLEGAAA